MIGPYTSVDVAGGGSVDLYLLRFDKDGGLLSPRTLAMILERAVGHSDVFVFSHGWNNTFDVARDKYVTFIEGYAAQRQRLNQTMPTRPTGYRPMLIGVIWPSTSFVMPWERGPSIAAAPDLGSEQEEMLRLVGAAMEPQDFAALAELLDGVEGLDDDAAQQAADLVVKALSPGTDPEDSATSPSAEEFVMAWRLLEGGGAPAPRSPGGYGTATGATMGPSIGTNGPAGEAPRAAGGGALDPRGLLRTATVWLMKDRAGTVGAAGVAPILQQLVDIPEPRLHLVGHSFGARVMLSAATLQRSTRKAHSLLLLQPAVNRWCFADEVVGRGVPGGYRSVLDKVERPVLTTFSRHDVPLHEAFHLAVRGSSLGEPNIAAIGDTGRFGALGGYGPAGIENRLTRRQAVREGTPYQLDGLTGVVQIDGDVAGVKVPNVDENPDTPAIAGHSDINTTITWWALHSLTGS